MLSKICTVHMMQLPDDSKLFIEKLVERLEENNEADIYTEFVEQERAIKLH